MRRTDLVRAVQTVKTETRDALQTMYDELNRGQRNKLNKNEKIKALFERYGVAYSEAES